MPEGGIWSVMDEEEPMMSVMCKPDCCPDGVFIPRPPNVPDDFPAGYYDIHDTKLNERAIYKKNDHYLVFHKKEDRWIVVKRNNQEPDLDFLNMDVNT